MSEHPAVTAVRDRACALLQPNGKHAIAMDVDTFAHPKPDGKPAAVLVAIATRGASVVVAVDAAELAPWPGVTIARLLGIEQQVPKKTPKQPKTEITPPARRG